MISTKIVWKSKTENVPGFSDKGSTFLRAKEVVIFGIFVKCKKIGKILCLDGGRSEVIFSSLRADISETALF